MSVRSLFRLIVAGLVGLLYALSVSAQGSKPDSTQSTAQGPLAPSYCPNITTQWYAAGAVPVGYYKSAADGACYPIPSCRGGEAWDSAGQSCACPAGTAWDAASTSCHAPCAAGSTWNGTACESVCFGGQSWNGATCACPSGAAWNGTTCGVVPSFGSFGVTPATSAMGVPYSVSWSTAGTGPITVTLACSGANSAAYTLSPSAAGTGSLPDPVYGATTCAATATNGWGSVTTPPTTVSAVCPSNRYWNGSACAVALPTSPPSQSQITGGAMGCDDSVSAVMTGANTATSTWNRSADGRGPGLGEFMVKRVQKWTFDGSGWSGVFPTQDTIVNLGENPAHYCL